MKLEILELKLEPLRALNLQLLSLRSSTETIGKPFHELICVYVLEQLETCLLGGLLVVEITQKLIAQVLVRLVRLLYGQHIQTLILMILF